MSFLNPAGLWGLLGIPVLILIYIIKPKFQEKIVTSTFIWKLSQNYKKKSIPWQISNMLLFLVQLLAIAAISMILARPVIVTADGAAEKIVILDASASMMVEGTEGSRFEVAKMQISELADKMESHGKMTVILAGTESYFLVERSSEERDIKTLVAEAECTYGEADLGNAFLLAERVLSENPEALVYFFTDKQYDAGTGIKVVDVSEKAWNVAVCGLEVNKAENKELIFSAELASYGKDTTATVVLYVDNVLADVQLVSLLEDIPATVEFSGLGIRQYDTARVYVEAADAILADNEYHLLDGQEQLYEVLLVSEEPVFLEAALLALNNVNVTTVASLDMLDAAEQTLPDGTVVESIPSDGYDLYVYDTLMPKELPGDGAVWMIYPEKLPSGVSLKLKRDTEANAYMKAAPDSGSELYATLSKGISVEDVYISKSMKISSALGFETIYTCNEDPVILAGETNNVRAVVWGFDLSASNLPLRIAFPALIHNMAQYSLVPVLEKSQYEVGDQVTLNKENGVVLASVRGSDVDAVAENHVRMPVSFMAEKPGLYTVALVMADDSVEKEEYFVRLAPEESNLSASGGSLPELEQSDAEVKYEKEITWWFVAILLVLIVVEWGLQYREQF